MSKSTIWAVVIAVVILAILVYLYNRATANAGSSSVSTGGKQNTPSVNTSNPPTIPCNANAERMIVRDCNWQNPVFDGCTYVKKDQKPGTNQCYWFKQ